MDNTKTKIAAISVILVGIGGLIGAWAHGTLSPEIAATFIASITAGASQLFHLGEQH